MSVIIWFRNDLRIHDHPALAAAEAEQVIPVFIVDTRLTAGPSASDNRNQFLLQCLAALRQSLQHIGADLVVRQGSPETVLSELAEAYGASAVYCTADYTPYAQARDQRVALKLAQANVGFRAFPGRLVVDELAAIRTKSGTVHKIFTPFYRAWSAIERRDTVPAPRRLAMPHGLKPGELPAFPRAALHAGQRPPDIAQGGEAAARTRLEEFLIHDVHYYHQSHNDMAANRTSRLSPYIHFGCISVREIEASLPPGDGPAAFRRQLCWRDFYNYVLLNFPDNAIQEYQERYRHYPWVADDALLQAWKAGRTGYPIVDAAMRQLQAEGWMHNRGRLIVGSFLTKDLGIDWREGERHFMQLLLDGDKANNNGNWQWIASVGVDPAPVFRRLYNPVTQHKTYDPASTYVRRYVPELNKVPDAYIYEPWKMPASVQEQAGCVIGRDYPAPIVDHAEARKAALDKYRSV